MSVDVTYETPNQHNNPIEMHATVARWDGDVLRMWDANQGPHNLVPVITEAFGITADQLHITSPYVGGRSGPRPTRTCTSSSPAWPRRSPAAR